jgi:hypothetical protein
MLSVKAIEEAIDEKIPEEVDYEVWFVAEVLSPPQRSRDGTSQLRTLDFIVQLEVPDSEEGWAIINQTRDQLTGFVPDGCKHAFYQSHGQWDDDHICYLMQISIQTVLPYRGFNL